MNDCSIDNTIYCLPNHGRSILHIKTVIANLGDTDLLTEFSIYKLTSKYNTADKLRNLMSAER